MFSSCRQKEKAAGVADAINTILTEKYLLHSKIYKNQLKIHEKCEILKENKINLSKPIEK
ncbi:MAG: hypothetical protein ACI4Q6_09890 [Huintestinicola sp.]